MSAIARVFGLSAAVVCALGGLASPARAETAGRVLACVQQRYAGMRDLSARFVQESRMATLGRPRKRAGRIQFQAPGKMRWEYDAPDRQLMVSDGKTFWLHQPAQKQVVVQKISQAFTRQTPLLFLFGKGDFATEFTWDDREPPPGAGGTVQVELRPRTEAPDLVRLTLEVVPGDCRLAASSVEDAFGNVTRLDLSEERRDAGLDAALFRFTIPPGTEVVRP
jgi:outer membrane lipoprotein carrier protein